MARPPRIFQTILLVLLVQLGLVMGSGLLMWVVLNQPTGHWARVPLFLGTGLILALGLVSSVLLGVRWRRQADESLQEVHGRFRHLVDSIEGIVWEEDVATHTSLFVSRKAEEIMGYSVDEWYRDPLFWRKHLHPDDRDQTIALFEENVARRKPFTMEYRLMQKDGRAIWLRDIVSVTVVEGKTVTVNGVMVDITDRKRVQDELEQALREIKVREEDLTTYKNHLEELVMARSQALFNANKELRIAWEKAEESNRMKSNFLANMSHELRTPLNAIILYSELVLEEVDNLGQKETGDDIRRIQAAGKHLLSLIDNILDLSKLDVGRIKLTLEDIDVPAMIHEITSNMTPMIIKNGNHILLELDPTLRTMATDQIRLRQILINLLSNASKFTTHGTITVGTQAGGDASSLVFFVRDTGIGMTKEEQIKAFQRFAQADTSTTRKFGGTGLGLTLSQRLAELLGGTLWVESEEGQGSTFFLSLPRQLPAIESEDGMRLHSR